MQFLSWRVAFVFCLISILVVSAATPQEMPVKQEVYAAKEMMEADLTAELNKMGHSRENTVKNLVQIDWTSIQKGNFDTTKGIVDSARKLDPDNGDAYRGLARVAVNCGETESEVERLPKIALRKSRVSGNAYIDYGHFLLFHDCSDESLFHFKKNPRCIIHSIQRPIQRFLPLLQKGRLCPNVRMS